MVQIYPGTSQVAQNRRNFANPEYELEKLREIADEDVVKIRNKYKNNSSEEKKEKKTNPNKVQKEPKTTPVIIRREVIIEEDSKKEVVKKEVQRENKNPFVQRKEKKDYNIVYRNKPEKPKKTSSFFFLKLD